MSRIGFDQIHFWKSPKTVDSFVRHWNHSSRRRSLAGIGRMRLCCEQFPSQAIILSFDNDGFVELASQANVYEFTISADINDWLEFFNGAFKATEGVLSGKLKLEGDLQHVLPYSKAINTIVDVANQVIESGGSELQHGAR